MGTTRGWTIRAVEGDRHVELATLVRGQPRWRTTLNVDAADSVGADELHPGGSTGYELSGLGVLLGIWDGGAVLTSHQELTFRSLQVDAPSGLSNHATHVAGTMMGGGVDPAARGMAYVANIDCYDWNDDTAEMHAEASLNDLRISNHSYGFAIGWRVVTWDYGDGPESTWAWYGDAAVSETEDYLAGHYHERAVGVDQVAYDNPRFLQCWAAANDRDDFGPAPGGRHIYQDPDNNYEWTESFTPRDADGPWDCIPPAQIAKNVLTVGAVHDVPGGYTEPGDVRLAGFSSTGPADDGRIKPDIVANGIELYSAQASGTTAYAQSGWSGTSMATPNASGTLGLLLDHWRRTFGGAPATDPLASTMKAIVIHTADETGDAPGPDYEFGWGLLDAVGAADLIVADTVEDLTIQELSLAQGQVYELALAPAPGAQEIRATCVWTDPPGPEAPAALDPPDPALVNDLDLRIVRVGGGTHYPWRLDRDNPSAPATNAGDNSVDNVEQVVLAPAPGATYRLTVGHKGTLTNGPQAFSLVLTGAVAAPTPSCPGDVNGDGVTNTFDFADLADNFGAGPGATREMGDLNGDGFVDIFDFGDLADDFGCGT
jgi:hypothetical protein